MFAGFSINAAVSISDTGNLPSDEGVPLALVLAASWVALLSPEEIVLELKQGFDFLEADLHDVSEHQRSIHAIFDYT